MSFLSNLFNCLKKKPKPFFFSLKKISVGRPILKSNANFPHPPIPQNQQEQQYYQQQQQRLLNQQQQRQKQQQLQQQQQQFGNAVPQPPSSGQYSSHPQYNTSNQYNQLTQQQMRAQHQQHVRSQQQQPQQQQQQRSWLQQMLNQPQQTQNYGKTEFFYCRFCVTVCHVILRTVNRFFLFEI